MGNNAILVDDDGNEYKNGLMEVFKNIIITDK